MFEKWPEGECSVQGAKWRKCFSNKGDQVNQCRGEDEQKEAWEWTPGVTGELSKCGFLGVVEGKAWLEWLQEEVEDKEVQVETVDWWNFAVKEKQINGRQVCSVSKNDHLMDQNCKNSTQGRKWIYLQLLVTNSNLKWTLETVFSLLLYLLSILMEEKDLSCRSQMKFTPGSSQATLLVGKVLERSIKGTL